MSRTQEVLTPNGIIGDVSLQPVQQEKIYGVFVQACPSPTLRDTLTNDHNVIFHPRTRKLHVPILSSEYLQYFFKDEHIPYALVHFGAIRDYFYGQVISDSFTNHTERRLWRKALHEIYGAEFYAVYEEHNQLRVNLITEVCTSIESLALLLQYKKKQRELAGYLRSIHKNMWNEINGISPNKSALPTYDEWCLDQKFVFVRKLIGTSLDVLNKFCGNTSDYESIFVT